jgi:thioredoxin reductase
MQPITRGSGRCAPSSSTASPTLGGQVTALYPDKYIYDVAGFPKILGKDLIRNQVEQMMQYSPTVVLHERVERLEQLPDGVYKLTTHTGGEHFTKVVLITAGIGAFTPRRYNRPEIDRYEGRGLYYAVRSREEFRDRRVLVVGGGDSALDWALNLLPLVRELTLIHRRDQFRAHEDSVHKLLSSPARVKLFYELQGLVGDDRVEGAVIVNTRTKEQETLEVDAVLVFLGLVSDLGPIREWGLELVDDSVVVNTKMETNRPGIYAAGDIATYPGKTQAHRHGVWGGGHGGEQRLRRRPPRRAGLPRPLQRHHGEEGEGNREGPGPLKGSGSPSQTR